MKVSMIYKVPIPEGNCDNAKSKLGLRIIMKTLEIGSKSNDKRAHVPNVLCMIKVEFEDTGTNTWVLKIKILCCSFW